MKIAVIGAGGFIGSAVCRALVRRHDIAVEIRQPANATGLAAILASLEAALASHCDVAVHAAADVGSSSEIREACESRLIDGLAVAGVPTIVIGSAAVLAASAPDTEGRLSERATPEPTTGYGRFKLTQERLVLAARQRAWRATIARLFNPVGPGMRPDLMLGRLVSEIVRRECEGTPFEAISMGPLSSIRDFMHVDDAADAIVALAHHRTWPQVVHVARGVGVAVRDLVTLALEQAAVSGIVVSEAATSPSASAEVASSIGDSTLLQTMTGWAAARTLEAAIADALREARRRQVAVPPVGA